MTEKLVTGNIATERVFRGSLNNHCTFQIQTNGIWLFISGWFLCLCYQCKTWLNIIFICLQISYARGDKRNIHELQMWLKSTFGCLHISGICHCDPLCYRNVLCNTAVKALHSSSNTGAQHFYLSVQVLIHYLLKIYETSNVSYRCNS